MRLVDAHWYNPMSSESFNTTANVIKIDVHQSRYFCSEIVVFQTTNVFPGKLLSLFFPPFLLSTHPDDNLYA